MPKLLSTLLLIFAAGCNTVPAKISREALNRHVIRSEAYYERYVSAELENRVFAAPPEIVDYLLKDNAALGFPNKPEAAALAPEIAADFRAAIAELPVNIRKAISNKVTGVFVVRDLGGSAYTDVVYSKAGKPVKGFIILDISATDRKANEWLTWKENSPFQPDAAYSLQAMIEEDQRNTRRYAIQFILLHEFAHALSIGEHATPLWGTNPSDITVPAQFPFFATSWSISVPVAPATKSTYVSNFKSELPNTKKILYYLPQKTTLTASQMPAIYKALELTNFLTLYGATNPFDDFAEAFATYVHGVLLKRPYRITISKDGKAIQTYMPCWSAQRYKEKRKALEEFIALASNAAPTRQAAGGPRK